MKCLASNFSLLSAPAGLQDEDKVDNFFIFEKIFEIERESMVSVTPLIGNKGHC